MSPVDPHPNAEYHALLGASLYEEAVLPLVLQKIARVTESQEPVRDQMP